MERRSGVSLADRLNAAADDRVLRLPRVRPARTIPVASLQLNQRDYYHLLNRHEQRRANRYEFAGCEAREFTAEPESFRRLRIGVI